MKSIFSTATKLFLGLLLGIVPALWIIQNNRHVKKLVIQSLISYLENKWNAEIIVQDSSIDLFRQNINFEHLQIKSKNKAECRWCCEHGRLHILPLTSIRNNRIELHIDLLKSNIETEYSDNGFGLANLLKAIFKTKSKYFKAQSFFIDDPSVILKKSSLALKAQLKGSIFIKNDQNSLWHGKLQLTDGSILLKDKPVINHLYGSSIFHQTNDKDRPFESSIRQRFSVPFIKDDLSCLLNGEWNNETKYITLKDEQDTVSLSLTTSNDSFQLRGGANIKELFANNLVYTMSTEIVKKDAEVSGDLYLTHLKNMSSAGNFVWDTKKNELVVTLQNQKIIELFANYGIAPKNLSVKIILDKEKHICGNYSCCLSNKTRKISTNGTFKVEPPLINIYGMTPRGSYSSVIDWSRNDFVFRNNTGYDFVLSFLPMKIRRWLIGSKGTISTMITRKSKDTIDGQISYSGGKINIAGNYNIITGMVSEFSLNIKERKIVLKNTLIDFQKGKVTAPYATIQWNESGDITFVHSYVQVEDLLVNWKNDIFAFIDGQAFIKQERNTPLKISGDLIIKRSLFKDSIFSGNIGSVVMQSGLPFTSESPTISLDLNIVNEEDLVIKTPFLQTRATANLKLVLHAKKNRLASPLLHGNIILRKGVISFPKNKLIISSGEINFIPTQISNPMIHLLAQNHIRKYIISLNITGPLQKPTVILESSPSLPEEKIIALLFSGSENINFRSDLPAIVLQNLNTLIFGSKKELSTPESFFKAITKPLKYIQIAPDFTNQYGRGGVRGTISVEVTKQLHAIIQKNLTMQEDFSFLLEYFLTDNFNVKAIKDYRGDFGAEAEVVLKP